MALESGKPKSHVARDLNISDGLLYAWITKYDEAKSKGLTPAEHQAEKDGLEPWVYLLKVFTDLPNVNSLPDVEALLPSVNLVVR